jgi:acyl-CoA dehydrogenase
MVPIKYKSQWMDHEIHIFRNTVSQFIQKDLIPNQVRWREQHFCDPEAWTAAGRFGILLPDMSEELGGGGGTFAHEAVIVEELARVGIHFGCTVHCIMAHYILAYGSEEQKHQWLPRMASGELVGAIAMSEPDAGSDLQGIRTTARRDGDYYIVNGSKTFITNGWHADLVCLAVKTDLKAAGPMGISLLIIETKDLSGYHVGRPLEKIGMSEQDTCELYFEDVRVPISNLLGSTEGKGFSQMMEQLSYERLTVGIGALATAEQAVNITTKYVKERKVSGKPLFDFQNTRFKLAECKTETHIGRVFIDNCIERFIAGGLDSVTCAMAKYWLSDCACRIIDECVQLHGGYGYMLEYPIAHLWMDSRVQRIYAGPNEIMKELIAWSI